MTATTHHHPRPRQNTLIQRGALALAALMLLAALGQAALALLVQPGGLFWLTALATLLLVAPVLMLTAVSPSVSVSEGGLRLHPVVWPARDVPWAAVRALKPWPLLPPAGTEPGRRAMLGPRYAPAEGIMVVVPTLPWVYRMAGFFAGEGGTPVLALTNRTHTDYPALAAALTRALPHLAADLAEERPA